MNVVDRVPEYIRKLVPYQPGKPIEEVEREYGIANSIKLASNENPLGPSPKAVQAMRDKLEKLLEEISFEAGRRAGPVPGEQVGDRCRATDIWQWLQ